MKKKVLSHLKDDVRTFEHEKKDDKKLIKKLKSSKKKSMHERRESKGKEIIEDEMRRFKEGRLHSGSKKGPIVKNPKQAIAIALTVKRKKTK